MFPGSGYLLFKHGLVWQWYIAHHIILAVFILLPAEGVKTHFLVLAIPLLGRETVEIS